MVRAQRLLSSLLAALRITGWAGISRGHRSWTARRTGVRPQALSLAAPTPPDESCSARRVSRRARPPQLPGKGALTHDQPRLPRANSTAGAKRLQSFRNRLRDARFAGIVLDYDGTVVDTRHRFDPPEPKMAAELVRLAEGWRLTWRLQQAGANRSDTICNALPSARTVASRTRLVITTVRRSHCSMTTTLQTDPQTSALRSSHL